MLHQDSNLKNKNIRAMRNIRLSGVDRPLSSPSVCCERVVACLAPNKLKQLLYIWFEILSFILAS